MRRKQSTIWYKANIETEVDSVKKYILVLCRGSGVKIYMSGRLAKMLVGRSIIVNLQGCTSHSATNWQILQRLKGSCLPLQFQGQGLSSSTFMGLSFQKWTV